MRRSVREVIGLPTRFANSLRQAIVVKSASCVTLKEVGANSSATAPLSGCAGRLRAAAVWCTMRPGETRSTEQ
jgi:hypothetical protein